MTALLDTDVIVDYLRGNPAARAWLESKREEPLCVPGVVAMELVVGCRDQKELRTIQGFLSTMRVIWPEATEFAAAFELLATHRLKCGLSIPDCLVAAMSMQREAVLYTFNIRHYGLVEGLDVRAPYSRS